MFKNKSFLCIIPARSGSKRIKNKNLVNFLGSPLILKTIEAALKSVFIDDIYVTTNDKKILRLCKKINIKTINRPAKLCNPIIMPDFAVLHAYKFIKKKYDYIITLQPTSPLRDSNDIDRSIIDIVTQQGDSLISVFESKYFMWEKKKKFYKPINYDYKNRPRSQDFSFYVENGAIQITKPKILLKTNNRLGGNICISIMSENKSIDIDNYDDLKKAKLLAKIS